jgi:carboxymethylenebutenolidase
MRDSRRLPFIICSGTVVIAAACGGGSASTCGNTILSEVKSPVAELEAVVFNRDCGALPSFSSGPDTVVVKSGNLSLRGLLWTPSGTGPFPAVLFSHGSYGRNDTLTSHDLGALGPVFSRHGYVFLFLCRRGIGLSADQGPSDGELMDSAMASRGTVGRNEVQLQLLEGEELNEALAGLAFLRALPRVDASRISLAGHSFGGSLTLFLAARDTALRAAVVFSGAAGSWGLSPGLRMRLLADVRHAPPVFFIHTANDYSTASGKALAAEMQRLGRPHRLKIYPAFGQTPYEGHNFLFHDAGIWETDVFGFLDSIR